MHTSIRFLTVATFLMGLGASASAQEVPWQTSYQQGRQKSQDVRRPLAVLIGDGSTGFNQITSEGSLSPDIRKILADHYVCVYLDTQKKENQAILSALTIQTGHGLVLSDASAEVQAFFHDGQLSTTELKRQLQRYSDPSEKITKTAYLSTVSFVSYQSPEAPVVRQSNYPPLTTNGFSFGATQEFSGFTRAPAYSPPSFAPTMSGGGRNC